MVGWPHWLDGHESEQAPGVGDGQGSLVCFSTYSHIESDMTDCLNWTGHLQLGVSFSKPVLFSTKLNLPPMVLKRKKKKKNSQTLAPFLSMLLLFIWFILLHIHVVYVIELQQFWILGIIFHKYSLYLKLNFTCEKSIICWVQRPAVKMLLFGTISLDLFET